MGSRLDPSMMLVIHAALRRDLEQVARIAGRRNSTDATRLRAALGWQLFKKFLVVHHQVEDDALWPALRATVAGHPDQLALVDALEQEHAVIDPLLLAIDHAADNHATADKTAAGDGSPSFGDIIDELITKLGGHLAHEESDGLDLIGAALSLDDWQRFGRVHGQRLLGDAPTYMPWLLDQADPRAVATFLANVPAPLAEAYRGQWASDYAGLKLWDGSEEPGHVAP
jgi:Hemerythrin HHE cation binding domain